MTIYNKFGYTLKLLKRDNGKEVFQYLAKYKFKEDMQIEERAAKRANLKKIIVNELDIENHTPIGIYKDGRIIGLCFTELHQAKDTAKMSYIKIDEEHIKTKGPQVLFNFIMNILYKDIKIIFNNNMLNRFGNIVRKYPRELGISSFKNDYRSRLKKYFEEH